MLIPYSGPHLALLQLLLGLLLSCDGWASCAISILIWLWLQLADSHPWLTIWHWYPCIYNTFFQLSFWLSSHIICLHPCIACFLVITLLTQLDYPVTEIPDWRLCQRSICNMHTHTHTHTHIYIYIYIYIYKLFFLFECSVYLHLTMWLHLSVYISWLVTFFS